MSCRIFNVNAHNRIFSAHALWSETNRIDTVFQQFFHGSCTFVFIVASKWTHQCFLGKKRCGFHGSRHTYPYQKRRTCIKPIGCHDIHNKFRNPLITCTRHQNHGFSRKGTSASCHVGIDFTLIAVRNDIPEYSRRSFSHIFAGIVFVKCLYTVVAKRCFKRCFHNSFF